MSREMINVVNDIQSLAIMISEETNSKIVVNYHGYSNLLVVRSYSCYGKLLTVVNLNCDKSIRKLIETRNDLKNILKEELKEVRI